MPLAMNKTQQIPLWIDADLAAGAVSPLTAQPGSSTVSRSRKRQNQQRTPAPTHTALPTAAPMPSSVVLETGTLAQSLCQPGAQSLPAPQDFEAAAALLAQHPDYRLLRRLVPRHHWGPSGQAPTRRVIVLDTETTGLDPAIERIIELAMLSVEVDTVTGLPVGPVTVYASFEDPGKPIAPAIREITGIEDSMVKGQRIDDARVNAMVTQADLVVAHNAGFDRPFVEARLPVFASKPWNCSFAGIDWKREGSGSAKLTSLAAERGWFYDAHRAQMDCHALLQLLACSLADGRTGLQHLIDGAARTRYKLWATGAPFDARQALKARGYRWDNDARTWWTQLPSQALLEAECQWLESAVYTGHNPRLQLEALDSLVQFSGRRGVISVYGLPMAGHSDGWAATGTRG
jgi:DNA polymerase III subunit epsilon